MKFIKTTADEHLGLSAVYFLEVIMNDIRIIKIRKNEIIKAWLLQRKGFKETLKNIKITKQTLQQRDLSAFIINSQINLQTITGYFTITKSQEQYALFQSRIVCG